MPLQHLDPHARAVIELANRIAHESDLEYVGTEHILLAILRHNGGIGAQVLAKLGIDEPKAAATIAQLVQRQKEDTWVFGRLPGSPNYRHVIEHAIEESKQLDAGLIGSEHLLLGLLREKHTTGEQALRMLGVNLKSCREEVQRQLAALPE